MDKPLTREFSLPRSEKDKIATEPEKDESETENIIAEQEKVGDDTNITGSVPAKFATSQPPGKVVANSEKFAAYPGKVAARFFWLLCIFWRYVLNILIVIFFD